MADLPSVRPISLPDFPDTLSTPSRAEAAARVGILRLGATALVGAVLLVIWILLARSTSVNILPGPDVVWSQFVQTLQDGTFVPAFLTTAEEAVLGWMIGVLCALPLGYAIGRFRPLEDALAPYLAGSQAMPIVAIAPLLVVWLGYDLAPKVAVCALITFFPVLATTASGIRGVPSDLIDAAHVFGAGHIQMARLVYLPLAARTIFAGLKVAAALSVTGAVVGEFVASDAGLGYLINFGRTNLETPLTFVALIALIGLGALAYTAVSLVERVVLRWDDPP